MWFQLFDGVNHGQLVLTCEPYSGHVPALVTLHPTLRFLQKKSAFASAVKKYVLTNLAK